MFSQSNLYKQYPFGNVINELSYGYISDSDTVKYRYGFNGEEIESCISGDGIVYDLGARFYDSRLGRMFSLDPLMNYYTSFSPYSYCYNSPTSIIDIKGMGGPFIDFEETGNSSSTTDLTDEDRIKYTPESITLVENSKFAFSSVEMKRSLLDCTSKTLTVNRSKIGKFITGKQYKTIGNTQYEERVVFILSDAISSSKYITYITDESSYSDGAFGTFGNTYFDPLSNRYILYLNSDNRNDPSFGADPLFEELEHLYDWIHKYSFEAHTFGFSNDQALDNLYEEINAKRRVIQYYKNVNYTYQYVGKGEHSLEDEAFTHYGYIALKIFTEKDFLDFLQNQRFQSIDLYTSRQDPDSGKWRNVFLRETKIPISGSGGYKKIKRY